MTRLPTLSPKKIIAALKECGFQDNGWKGSHLFLWHPEKKLQTCVPVHGNEDIGRSLLRKILKQAGLSEEEFRELL